MSNLVSKKLYEILKEKNEKIIPENIKKDVQIFNITGTCEGSGSENLLEQLNAQDAAIAELKAELKDKSVRVDTSDANAVSNDLLLGKVAYANNEKLEGTIEEYDGSYTGNTAKEIIITDANHLFANNARMDYLNEFLAMCKKVKSTGHMFYECNFKTLDISMLDTSEVTTMYYMFTNCTNLISLDLSNFNTSKVTVMNAMFSNCKKLKNLNVSSFDTSKVTVMSSMFTNCTQLENLDISNFDMSCVKTPYYMFTADNKLTNLQFGFNLGKGYTQKSSNYRDYTLDLSTNKLLTHDSLMSVINGLYDLNLTYDVANGGTLYTQSLVLGTTNLAKLTEDEIAIATNKGWNVT